MVQKLVNFWLNRLKYFGESIVKKKLKYFRLTTYLLRAVLIRGRGYTAQSEVCLSPIPSPNKIYVECVLYLRLSMLVLCRKLHIL